MSVEMMPIIIPVMEGFLNENDFITANNIKYSIECKWVPFDGDMYIVTFTWVYPDQMDSKVYGYQIGVMESSMINKTNSSMNDMVTYLKHLYKTQKEGEIDGNN